MTTVQIGDTLIYAHDIVSARILMSDGEHKMMIDCIHDGDIESTASLRFHIIPCATYGQAQKLLAEIKSVMETTQPYVLIDEDDDEEGVYDDGQ